jgi:hypothetical protein
LPLDLILEERSRDQVLPNLRVVFSSLRKHLGPYVAITRHTVTLRVFYAWQTTQELIDHAKECCAVRELTDAEREQFGLGPR